MFEDASIMKNSLACVCATIFLAAAPADAHHSLAATYLLDQEVEIHGTVSDFLYRNPHSFLRVEAPDEAGKMQSWAIEWGGGGQLGAWGIGRGTMKAGDEVTILMRPGRDPQGHRGLIKIIRRPADGFEWGTKPGETIQEWSAR
jgi:hypothetical protein